VIRSGRIFLWGGGQNGQIGDESLPEICGVKEIFIDDIEDSLGNSALNR